MVNTNHDFSIERNLMANIKHDFPILSTLVHGKPLIYLDSAATAQKPKIVIDTISDLYSTCNGNIHRGIHYMAELTTEKYEAARENVRSFINAGSTSEIVFTSGATASINLVAYSFGEQFIAEGDNIIVSEMDHHSNIVPWQLIAGRKKATLKVLPFNDDGTLRIEDLHKLIDEKTRIIAVTQASNVLGTLPDIKQITDIAHAHGVPVLVDGCQGIVHSETDVCAMDVDFYCFSGHKLYGPTGIGVLYGKEKWLEKMPPFMGGGDMISAVSFKETKYAELPLKFEAGTSNFIDAIGLGAAIDYLKSLPDLRQIHKQTQKLNTYFSYKLKDEVGDVIIYGTADNKCPITSFAVKGTHPMDIAMIVDKLGVAIRSGMLCAEPVMQHYGITSMCRASFSIYNTQEDADIAIAAIKNATHMLRG